MGGLWQGVREVAQIFDVPKRGEALVAELRDRESTAIKAAQALGSYQDTRSEKKEGGPVPSDDRSISAESRGRKSAIRVG